MYIEGYHLRMSFKDVIEEERNKKVFFYFSYFIVHSSLFSSFFWDLFNISPTVSSLLSILVVVVFDNEAKKNIPNINARITTTISGNVSTHRIVSCAIHEIHPQPSNIFKNFDFRNF